MPEGFATHDVNITKRESRPWHGRTWEYVFYWTWTATPVMERVRSARRPPGSAPASDLRVLHEGGGTGTPA